MSRHESLFSSQLKKRHIGIVNFQELQESMGMSFQESMAVRGASSSDDAQEISDDQNAMASKTQVQLQVVRVPKIIPIHAPLPGKTLQCKTPETMVSNPGLDH